MQLGYFKLLEVACGLESFSSSTIFSFHPLAETATELSRHGLLYRNTDSGFVLLYQARRDESTDTYAPLRPLPVELKLSFGLATTVNTIAHISKLPFHTPGRKIFYFDNLTERKDGETLYLNAEAPGKKFVSDQDLFPLQAIERQYSELTDSSAFMKIADARGNILSAKNCIPAGGKPGEKKIFFDIDLSDNPSGRYELIKDSTTLEKFYALPGGANLLGVIDLYNGSGVPLGCSFINADGAPIPKDFTLGFQERESTWRYHIIPKFDPDIAAGNLEIVDSKSRFNFTLPVETTTITGEKAFVIKSVEKIRVQEEVFEGIRLKVDDKPRIADLQNPVFTSITVENNKFFSDVYVYV